MEFERKPKKTTQFKALFALTSWVH